MIQNFLAAKLEDDRESDLDNLLRGDSRTYETFECRPPILIKLLDPTEVEEIREEEAPLIKRLDLLIDEFTREIHDLEIPLSEYIQTHWAERMYAELAAKDEISERERKELLDLGLTILGDGDEEKEESQTEEAAVESMEERKRRAIREYSGSPPSPIPTSITANPPIQQPKRVSFKILY